MLKNVALLNETIMLRIFKIIVARNFITESSPKHGENICIVFLSIYMHNHLIHLNHFNDLNSGKENDHRYILVLIHSLNIKICNADDF